MTDSGKVNIRGREYTTVAARVQAFREKNGDKYSIVTEIVSADSERVVMKATISSLSQKSLSPKLAVGDHLLTPSHVIATGHAEEVRTSSQINRTSALENAETSAIGRALAAFGMAGTEFASADEVAQAIHQQSAPKPALRPSVSSTSEPATPVQKRRIQAFLQGRGLVTADAQVKYLEDEFGVIPGSTLTKVDAAGILQELESMRGTS